MKKHVKILATLGLTMPLALTSVQAGNGSTAPMRILNEGTHVETDETNNNMVFNRISNFFIGDQDQSGLNHVNIHVDIQEVDKHTDIGPNGSGNHRDSHSDKPHRDKHTDKD